jgi:hypothetical protein
MRRRLFLLAALLWPLVGAVPSHATEKTLVLEEFFRGTLHAKGSFTSRIDGSKRGLDVVMKGTWDRKTQTLKLVEDFVFSNGEKDRKTWYFRKTGPGTYVGTREDVLGEARVWQDGPVVRLAYKARQKTKGGSTFDVRFDDVLRQTDAKTVINTATVHWFFLTVGDVELTIKKH